MSEHERTAAPDLPSAGPASAERLRAVVESIVGSRFTEGNEVTVLRNGVEIFPAMLDAIESSTRTIDFVTYIYWKGAIARRFADTLSRKAREGVRVRVLLDGLGSIPMDIDLIDQMSAAGAEVERFRPIVRWKVWQANHRTHRKILVCDDSVAFTGGVGIAEEWEGDARHPGEWRDTHFRIAGPAALGLRAAFLGDWRETGHPVDLADVAKPPKASGTATAAVVDGSAHIGFSHTERLLEALFAAAESRILVQTPYFNPCDEVVDLLVAARRRAVDIQLLLPGPHMDKRVCEIVADHAAEHLLDEGVRIWKYRPTMMHVKAVTIDGAMAAVGSANLNRRSVEKDEEVMLAVLDPPVVRTLEHQFAEDVADSDPILPGDGRLSLTERAVHALLRPIRQEM